MCSSYGHPVDSYGSHGQHPDHYGSHGYPIEHCSVPCCPPLKKESVCDCLDFDYRLTHNTTVDNRVIPVEVKIRLHIELCYGPLVLGDLVYSTTLLPGEKVRLFSTDRRTKFSSDSTEDFRYRDDQVSEEHCYMSSMSDFLSDITVKDKERSQNTAKSSSQTHIRASDFLDDLFCSPSIDITSLHNAYSTRDFLKELSQHVKTSDHRSEMVSRCASSVSIGRVHSRKHVETESEDQSESACREFSNLNKCYAVTYFFYRINKIQTLKVTLEFIECRVIDSATNTKVTNNPPDSDSDETPDTRPHAGRSAEAIPPEVQEQALRQVEEELAKVGLIVQAGGGTAVSPQAQSEFSYERHFSLPTPGIIVKGCLDDCNVCEPRLHREYELELEHKQLENQLLRREIECGQYRYYPDKDYSYRHDRDYCRCHDRDYPRYHDKDYPHYHDKGHTYLKPGADEHAD